MDLDLHYSRRVRRWEGEAGADVLKGMYSSGPIIML